MFLEDAWEMTSLMVASSKKKKNNSSRPRNPTSPQVTTRSIPVMVEEDIDFSRIFLQPLTKKEQQPAADGQGFWQSANEYNAKREEIHTCLHQDEQVNLWKLRSLAMSPGGFLCPLERKQVWPKLVAVHEQLLFSNTPNPLTTRVKFEKKEEEEEEQQQQAKDSSFSPSAAAASNRLEQEVGSNVWRVQRYLSLVKRNAQQVREKMEDQPKEEPIICKKEKEEESQSEPTSPKTTFHSLLEPPHTPVRSNRSHCPSPPTSTLSKAIAVSAIVSPNNDTSTTLDNSIHSTSTCSVTSSTEIGLDSQTGFPLKPSCLARRGRVSSSHEKNILFNILTCHSDSYYAGLSDWTSVCLMNMGSPSLTRLVLDRLATHHLKPWMTPQRSAQEESPRQVAATAICNLLQTVDSELYAHLQPNLDIVGKLGVCWASTWFAQDCLDATLVSRLFDLFLVSHPLMPLYTAVAMLTTHRTALLQIPREGNMAHALNYMTQECLSHELPRTQAQWRVEAVVQCAMQYMQHVPPTKAMGNMELETPDWMSKSTAPSDMALFQSLGSLERQQKQREVLAMATQRRQSHRETNGLDEEEIFVDASALEASPRSAISMQTEKMARKKEGKTACWHALILPVFLLVPLYLFGGWAVQTPDLQVVMGTLAMTRQENTPAPAGAYHRINPSRESPVASTIDMHVASLEDSGKSEGNAKLKVPTENQSSVERVNEEETANLPNRNVQGQEKIADDGPKDPELSREAGKNEQHYRPQIVHRQTDNSTSLRKDQRDQTSNGRSSQQIVREQNDSNLSLSNSQQEENVNDRSRVKIVREQHKQEHLRSNNNQQSQTDNEEPRRIVLERRDHNPTRSNSLQNSFLGEGGLDFVKPLVLRSWLHPSDKKRFYSSESSSLKNVKSASTEHSEAGEFDISPLFSKPLVLRTWLHPSDVTHYYSSESPVVDAENSKDAGKDRTSRAFDAEDSAKSNDIGKESELSFNSDKGKVADAAQSDEENEASSSSSPHLSSSTEKNDPVQEADHSGFASFGDSGSDAFLFVKPLVLRSWLHPNDKKLQFGSTKPPKIGRSTRTLLQVDRELAANSSSPIYSEKSGADRSIDSFSFPASKEPSLEGSLYSFDVSDIVRCDKASACNFDSAELGLLKIEKDGIVLPLNDSSTRDLLTRWKQFGQEWDVEPLEDTGHGRMIDRNLPTSQNDKPKEGNKLQRLALLQKEWLRAPIKGTRALLSTSFPLSWFVLLAL